jgi:predicted HTH transcriptional regulator
MHKYRKITKQQVVELFKGNKKVATKDIVNKYNCSAYSAIRHIETLVDDGVIKRSKYGYIKV